LFTDEHINDARAAKAGFHCDNALWLGFDFHRF